ncbi:ketopantoate reductase family protein, partial [Megasphaera sp. NM10]|uniref:ketopantoate reductase family protein n=1 Tax=Megasphaera sp. NM10 TaxID=1273103 RepID=UPI000356E2EC
MKRGKIVDSAIYITSSYKEDYSIRQEGRFARIYIGSDDADATKKVYGILNHPGLTCCIAENITVEIWRKFILNCAYNVLTAYYRTSIGGALSQLHGRKNSGLSCRKPMTSARPPASPCPTTSSDDQYDRILGT